MIQNRALGYFVAALLVIAYTALLWIVVGPVGAVGAALFGGILVAIVFRARKARTRP